MDADADHNSLFCAANFNDLLYHNYLTLRYMKSLFLMNRSLARQRLTPKFQISIISKARLLSTTPPKFGNNRIFDP